MHALIQEAEQLVDECDKIKIYKWQLKWFNYNQSLLDKTNEKVYLAKYDPTSLEYDHVNNIRDNDINRATHFFESTLEQRLSPKDSIDSDHRTMAKRFIIDRVPLYLNWCSGYGSKDAKRSICDPTTSYLDRQTKIYALLLVASCPNIKSSRLRKLESKTRI